MVNILPMSKKYFNNAVILFCEREKMIEQFFLIVLKIVNYYKKLEIHGYISFLY